MNFLRYVGQIFMLLVFAHFAWAAPQVTTYQARIIKPDGYPLEATNVNFKFTILNPAGNCILYSETYSSVSMSGTGGLMSFPLGSGIRVYPSSGTTFADVFDNSVASLTCDAGGPANYQPDASDIRKIVMQFNDGNGWQTLPAMNINAVPYAIYANDAMKLGGVSATSYVQYSTLPTCTASESLSYNGASFSCVAAGSAPTNVTSSTVITALGYTPADGASVTALSSSLSSTNANVSAVSSTLSNVSAYATAVSSTVYSVSSTVSTLQSDLSSVSATVNSALIKTNNLSDLTNAATARTNLGLGTFATANSLDLGSASATGTIADARLANQSGVTSGAQYTKVTVDGKGRVTSGAQLSASDVTTALGYTPQASGVISSQWSTSGTTINYMSGNVGIGTANPIGRLDIDNGAGYELVMSGSQGSNIYSPNSDLFVLAGSGKAIHLGANAANSQLVVSGGSVGIGITTPVTKLDVNGGVRISMEAATCAVSYAGTLRYNAGNVEFCNGSTWAAFGVSSSGLNSFNGSTSQTQTLANGGAGNAPAFNTSNGVHTLNIPLASATGSVTAGLISNADYVNFSNKITSSAASIAQVLGYVPASATALGNYLVKANNFSDLTSSATARSNLGLGTFATANTLDLGSASATGTLADARLADTGVAASTYTKVTVDTKGRVTSGAQLSASDVTTALGYTPTDSASNVSSQWNTSGTTINYTAGNVGIGTSSPTYLLEIKKSLNMGNVGINIENPLTGNNAAAMIQVKADASLAYLQQQSSGVSPSGSSQPNGTRLQATGSGGLSVAATDATSGVIRFLAGGQFDSAIKMVINPSGNVGIGTTTPSSVLEINKMDPIVKIKNSGGDIGGMYLMNSVNTGWLGMYNPSAGSVFGTIPVSTTRAYLAWDSAGKIGTVTNSFTTGNPGAPTYRNVLDDGSGNMGVGITAPGSRLVVKGAGTTSATSALNITDSSNNSILYVGNDGNVGIGTTTPGSNLEVYGDRFRLTDTSNAHLQIANTTSNMWTLRANTAGGFDINQSGYDGSAYGTSSTSRMTISSSGNIGVGRTAPVTTLDVSGGVRISMESAACAVGYAGTLRYNAGNVEFCNGSTWTAFGVATTGLTSLNGSTSQTQTFANGSTGNAPAFSTANGVHTLNIPLASATGSVTAGLISNADYLTFMNGSTGTVATSRLPAFAGDVSSTVGTNSLTVAGLRGVAVSTTAPVSGQVLTYNGSTWAPAAAGSSSQWTTSGTAISYSTGNVGIGTSAPATTLDVNGAATFRQAYFEKVGALGTLACGATNITGYSTNLYTLTACSSGTTILNIPTVTGWPSGSMSWTVTFFVTAQTGSTFNVRYNNATTNVFWDKNSTGGAGGANYSGFLINDATTNVFTCTVLNTGSVAVYCGVSAQY